MEYENLYKDFLEAVPECKKFCAEKVKENSLDDESGQHILFGLAVIPFIKQAALNKDEIVLNKIFEFMERMALAENEDVKICEVLDFTVLEQIQDEVDEIYNECKKHMRENTLEDLERVSEYIFR